MDTPLQSEPSSTGSSQGRARLMHSRDTRPLILIGKHNKVEQIQCVSVFAASWHQACDKPLTEDSLVGPAAAQLLPPTFAMDVAMTFAMNVAMDIAMNFAVNSVTNVPTNLGHVVRLLLWPITSARKSK